MVDIRFDNNSGQSEQTTVQDVLFKYVKSPFISATSARALMQEHGEPDEIEDRLILEALSERMNDVAKTIHIFLRAYDPNKGEHELNFFQEVYSFAAEELDLLKNMAEEYTTLKQEINVLLQVRSRAGA